MNLLSRIGINPREYNIEYGQSFEDEDRWKGYDDPILKQLKRYIKKVESFLLHYKMLSHSISIGRLYKS